MRQPQQPAPRRHLVRNARNGLLIVGHILTLAAWPARTPIARFGQPARGAVADRPRLSRVGWYPAAGVALSSAVRRRNRAHWPPRQTGCSPWRYSSTPRRDGGSSHGSTARQTLLRAYAGQGEIERPFDALQM